MKQLYLVIPMLIVILTFLLLSSCGLRDRASAYEERITTLEEKVAALEQQVENLLER